MNMEIQTKLSNLVCLMAILSGLVVNSRAGRYNTTTNVMDQLFSKHRYDKRLRPYFQEKPVNVTIGVAVVHFGQIREMEMDFAVDTFFYQEWHDDRLNHSLDYPMQLGGQLRSLLWLPDTFILNIKTAKFHNVPADNSLITIKSNGDVRWSTRLTLVAGCEMNLRDYPLDEQTCNLTMLSYAFQKADLDYFWHGNTDKAIEVINNEMNEFHLTSVKTSKEVFAYSTGPWTHVTATFHFKRRVGYSILQVYAPTVLIVSLSWLSFWISKDAVPARVTLGVTTVLTIVTLMGSFRSHVPKVSYVKAIDLFFIVSFIFVFGAVMEYIAILLRGRLKGSKAKEITCDPDDIRMGPLMSNDRPPECTELCDEQATSPKTGPSSRQRRKTSLFAKTVHRTKRSMAKCSLVERNADIIDRLSRVLFPVAYIVFNAIYWMYYSLATFKQITKLTFSRN